MGVAWVTEAFSYLINGNFIHWIFIDVVNILTGVFIFIIFVCKPKVFILLKLRISTFLPTSRRILPRIVHPVSGCQAFELGKQLKAQQQLPVSLTRFSVISVDSESLHGPLG